MGLGHARVELRLGIVDALPYSPFPACHRSLDICRRRAWERYWWRTRVALCGGYDGAGVVPAVDSGERVE